MRTQTRPEKSKMDEMGPTQETAAKLEIDVARELFLSGKIRQAHWDAALEIRAMYAAIGRGMFPAFRPREGGHVAGARVRDFLDLMTPAEYSAYEAHYKPWANKLGRRMAPVWDTVINNERPVALPLVVAGLQLYAEIAGFSSRRRVA